MHAVLLDVLKDYFRMLLFVTLCYRNNITFCYGTLRCSTLRFVYLYSGMLRSGVLIYVAFIMYPYYGVLICVMLRFVVLNCVVL